MRNPGWKTLAIALVGSLGCSGPTAPTQALLEGDWTWVESSGETMSLRFHGGDGRTLSSCIRRILSGRKIQEPASRIRRAFAGSALLLPLLLLPTLTNPAAGPTAIFVERVAVMEDGADPRRLHLARVLLDRPSQAASGTLEDEAFAAGVDWVEANPGS